MFEGMQVGFQSLGGKKYMKRVLDLTMRCDRIVATAVRVFPREVRVGRVSALSEGRWVCRSGGVSRAGYTTTQGLRYLTSSVSAVFAC